MLGFGGQAGDKRRGGIMSGGGELFESSNSTLSVHKRPGPADLPEAGPFRNTEYSRWLELKRDCTSLGTYGTTRSETRYC